MRCARWCRDEHHFPLRQAFHLAVRGASIGEPNITAVGDTDRFGTLGGHGPADLGAASMRQAIAAAGGTYDLSGPARVIGVDGSGDIGGAKPVKSRKPGRKEGRPLLPRTGRLA